MKPANGLQQQGWVVVSSDCGLFGVVQALTPRAHVHTQKEMLLVLIVVSLAVSAQALWPKPQSLVWANSAPLPLCATSGVSNLVFLPTVSSAVLSGAIARYQSTIFTLTPSPACTQSSGTVTVTINVTGSTGDRLDSTTDESYVLIVQGSTGSSIVAPSVYGALHALETVSQLVQRNGSVSLALPQVKIVDAPRFSFRGFLHDTSRHYLAVPVIKTLIDALAMSKFNVFQY